MEKNQPDEMVSGGLEKSKYGVKQLLAAVYVIIILSVFPLVYHDYYFDIMNFKYTFYYITTLVFIVLFLIISIMQGDIKWRTFFDFSNKKMPLTIPEISLMVFAVIAVISTIQSDFKYESFWGNEGRLTGCFLILLYCISILLISRSFKMKEWMLNLFLLSGILVCLFGITDYFQLDILKFKVNMNPNQINMFVSTIGNVNTYTSYVALVMGVSAVLFTTERTLWKVCFYYICMILSFGAIVMGLSDNSYLALGALFGLLPLYLFRSRMGIRRYLLMFTSFSLVIYGISLINRIMSDKVLKMSGILQSLARFDKLEYVVVVMVILSLLAYAGNYFMKHKEDDMGHRWQLVWLAFVLAGVVLLMFTLLDVNVFHHSERYGKLSTYLLFDDDWGTHRGYNWRIGLENYKKFPLIHKAFGYGPDTYGLVTHFNNFGEMIDKYSEVYDSAHNEYLQYFITMGPFSLISYLIFLISSGIYMVKGGKRKPWVMAILFAIICYGVQATVNISVPIVAPIMFCLLAIGLAGARNTN